MATPQWLRWASAAFLGFATLADVELADAEPRPAVVELFTSEGCNSCPPAEAYVGELAGRSDVLALAFHVDYWDDLGWRDRFGLSQSVERQRSYARSLRLSSVYTPEIVIDGRADYVGSNRVGIGNALKEKREGVPVKLSVGNGEAEVRLGARASTGRRQAAVTSCWLRTCGKRYQLLVAARMPGARWTNTTSCGRLCHWVAGMAGRRNFTRN